MNEHTAMTIAAEAQSLAAMISLDGQWRFLHAANDTVDPIKVCSITVPGPWQAQFEDLRMRAGTGIYARDFTIPPGWIRDHVFLRFGAVFHNAQVWINGTLVGAHEGGFLPFAFDVTPHLVEGANEVKVRVESPTDDPSEYPDAPFAEIPFGKQSWYGPLSGIWQSVFLERRIAEHIQRIRITPDLATGKVRFRIGFAAHLPKGVEIGVSVIDPDGNETISLSEHAAQGLDELGCEFTVQNVKAWSPEAPNLYCLKVSMREGGAIVDAQESSFGFRTIETREGRFYLNGQPLYLRGALDQDYYPDMICTTPSEAFLEDQFRKAKELGLNCLRCHIKAPDPRYYDVADRMGLLIWTELPNGGLSTERSRARKEATLKGIVDRDHNHPSIVIWTIINENWGVDLVHDAEHRNWLKRTFHWLKAYDPSRLVVDNSPLAPSFHVETDIADYHFYAAFPDNRLKWDKFVDQLALRASWLYSTEGDAVLTGHEPLVCSEFGNWGLPYPPDLADAQGEEPWWFETGHEWAEGVMYAHGVENRFADWSMDRVFGDLKRFIEAAQWQQFRALKYEIEAMRRKPALAGYVITEFTDCHWESNGLLDMRRNTRVFHEAFKDINADTVIVPRWERLSYWAGETVRLGLAIAHGAGETLKGAKLKVKGWQETELELPEMAPGTVASFGEIALEIPPQEASRQSRIDFDLTGADGTTMAHNTVTLSVHPPKPAAPAAALWSPDDDIRQRLEAMGYTLAQDAAGAALLIATELDAAAVTYTRAGGRLLLLPETEGLLQPLFPHWQAVKVVARAETVWQGDWASSFAWLRRGRAFDLPGGPLIDESFDRVLPTHVIANCNLLDFQARVYAGIVVGWLHKPAALLVKKAYGKGHFVASTFRLFRDAPGADPTATMLLDRIVRLALSDAMPGPRE